MQFKKSLLVEDLSKCMPGISSGQVTLEGADSFVFENNYVHTYNSAISVSEKLSQEMPNGVVNALDLYTALQKFPEDDCIVEETQTNAGKKCWLIKCGKIKLTVNLLESNNNIMERFTNITPEESEWINLNGQEFQDALKLCFMPSNKTKFAGVVFKDNYLISTDCWQINKATISTNLPFAWINNDAAKSLSSWNSFVAVQLNRTWLQFKSQDGVIFSVKTMFTENLPIDLIESSIEKTSAMNNVGSGSFTQEFFDAIDRASNFSQKIDEFNSVDLAFDSNGVTVRSHKSSGAYEEYVEGIKCPVAINVHVDPAMLMSTKGKFTQFLIFKANEVPGQETAVRFEFKTDTFLSLISSLN